MEKTNNSQPVELFTRKWLLIVIVCGALPFVLFAFLGNDPGRGRAAAISTAVIMYAARAFWELRGHAWFRVMLSIIVALHILLVLAVPWTSKSYPGLILFPIAVLDYAIVYGFIKLIEKGFRNA